MGHGVERRIDDLRGHGRLLARPGDRRHQGRRQPGPAPRQGKHGRRSSRKVAKLEQERDAGRSARPARRGRSRSGSRTGWRTSSPRSSRENTLSGLPRGGERPPHPRHRQAPAGQARTGAPGEAVPQDDAEPAARPPRAHQVHRTIAYRAEQGGAAGAHRPRIRRCWPRPRRSRRSRSSRTRSKRCSGSAGGSAGTAQQRAVGHRARAGAAAGRSARPEVGGRRSGRRHADRAPWPAAAAVAARLRPSRAGGSIGGHCPQRMPMRAGDGRDEVAGRRRAIGLPESWCRCCDAHAAAQDAGAASGGPALDGGRLGVRHADRRPAEPAYGLRPSGSGCSRRPACGRPAARRPPHGGDGAAAARGRRSGPSWASWAGRTRRWRRATSTSPAAIRVTSPRRVGGLLWEPAERRRAETTDCRSDQLRLELRLDERTPGPRRRMIGVLRWSAGGGGGI